jgi:hypothetical protein
MGRPHQGERGEPGLSRRAAEQRDELATPLTEIPDPHGPGAHRKDIGLQ